MRTSWRYRTGAGTASGRKRLQNAWRPTGLNLRPPVPQPIWKVTLARSVVLILRVETKSNLPPDAQDARSTDNQGMSPDRYGKRVR